MRSRHSRNAAGSPGERQLDGLAGQRLALAGEQQPRRAVDMVAAAARPASRIARPALGKPPARVARPLFPLFYLVEIRHRQLLQSIAMLHPLTGRRCLGEYNVNMAIT